MPEEQPHTSYSKKFEMLFGNSNKNKDIMVDTRNRVIVAIVIFVLMFCIVCFRIMSLALSDGRIVNNHFEQEALTKSFSRLNIVDRNGFLLASNLHTQSVYANPRKINNPDEVALKLSKALPDLKLSMLKKRLNMDKDFVWIKRDITPFEKEKIHKLIIPGLFYEQDETRGYLTGRLFSHILGYVGIDGKGLAGLEHAFDNYLTSPAPDVTGDLQLSLDLRVQEIVYSELSKAKNKYKAEAATAIVMNVSNGEIISMVSLPDFHPKDFNIASPDNKLNRASGGVYELGSIFKIFNTAMAIESGKIAKNKKYDVTEPIKIAGFRIRDYHPEKEPLNVTEILMHSSNIGSAYMANDVGGKYQKDFLKSLGLLDRTKIEISENAKPLYPNNWGKVSTMTISYGHGISVSPLHLIQASLPIVNGGLFYPATLIKKNETQNINAKRVIKKETSDFVRKAMRFVVKYGTGGNADAENYLVGGKTGSADKVGKKRGYRDENGIISSFLGVYPMNKPQYAVLVAVDNPKGRGYVTGGVVAAPVVKEIIEKISPIMHVEPVNEEKLEIRKEFWSKYELDEE